MSQQLNARADHGTTVAYKNSENTEKLKYFGMMAIQILYSLHI
jgi:hypothetical protein